MIGKVSTCVFVLVAMYIVPGEPMQITQCRGVDLTMAEDHVMHMNACLKDAGVTEVKDIPAGKMPCFGKCVFQKNGLVDEKGFPHKEKLQNMIKDHMPKEVHDDLNKRLEGCLIKDNTETIDPADETCTTYLPFLMCIHIAFLEECADADE